MNPFSLVDCLSGNGVDAEVSYIFCDARFAVGRSGSAQLHHPSALEGVSGGFVDAVRTAGGCRIFFFRAEDGIRDTSVTGVQTCALPISGFTGQSRMTAYLRTVGDPAPVMRAAREKVRQMDARLPITAMRTMEEQITGSLSAERMIASLSSVFRLLAALLATIELYGVMAYAVARSTREIGIGIALGAETRSVQWMVMRQVSLLVTAGLAVGIPAALALARLGRQWISGMFYGVPPSDPANFVLAALLMAGVALLAGFMPARREARGTT